MNQDNQNHEFPEIPADRYRILQNIGKGAFSRVFLAYTAEFQRRAIKRIRLTAKPHMLLKEIEFLRRLEGKSNIVQLKEIRFSDRTYQTTVITNYLDSDDFKSIILDFTPLDIQKYMKSLLQALAHLENAADPSGEIRGILHRDVKPGNFLFERATGKGLLIDFGLAQSLKEAREFPLMRLSRRQSYQFNPPYQRKYPISQPVSRESSSRSLPTQPHSGTHGYRAPEILVPVVNQNPKIDTWSAGVILLQIITGKTSIFRGNPNTDIYELLAIRAIMGADRFIQAMSSLGADFQAAMIAMPQNISLEELCEYYNPDLLAVFPKQGFDFCRRLLEFDPKRRMSASEALQHPFLKLKNLPDFRYQDGCVSKSIMSITGENEENAALKKRSQALAESLGLCKSTAETLAEEYSKMILSQMIPLSKDVRKSIEKAVQQFGVDQSQVVDIYDEHSGKSFNYIISRGRSQDFLYPSTSSVQELSSCISTTLQRPRLSSSFCDLVNYEKCDQMYQSEAELGIKELQQDEEFKQLSEPQKQKKLKIYQENLKSQIFQRQFELANQEKEQFERAVRSTAFRRRVDPWIQPLKALEKELRLCQSQVRNAAEEYRRLLIEKGVLQVDNSAAQAKSKAKSGFTQHKSEQKTWQQRGQKDDDEQRYDVAIQNNRARLALKQQIRHVFNQKYPQAYTESEARNNRLTAYFLANAYETDQAQAIIADAWEQATRRAYQHKSTNEGITNLQALYKRAAMLAITSHRIALNGPAGWNCQGYQYYIQEMSSYALDSVTLKGDMQSRAYQYQRNYLLYEQNIKDCESEMKQCEERLKQLKELKQSQSASLAAQNALLNKPGYNQQQVKARADYYAQQLDCTVKQAQQVEIRVSLLEKRILELRQLQTQEAKERADYFKIYKESIPKAQIDIEQYEVFENESNLWSETLTISDEFSEIKPGNALKDGQRAEKLQEPYFVSTDEIKRLFQLKDSQTQARKLRRFKMRHFERVYARFYDPNLADLEQLQREIFEERCKLQENQQQQAQRVHSEMLPREQQIGMLARAAAVEAISVPIRACETVRFQVPPGGQAVGRSAPQANQSDSPQANSLDSPQANPATEPTADSQATAPISRSKDSAASARSARDRQLFVNQKLFYENQQNAIYNLFSSPLGRFYIAFFRIINQRGEELTARDLLLQYFKKAEISIPGRIYALQSQLQQLATAYSKTSLGRSDLLLAAAATQSELDLRADKAQGALADIGLSRRSPNMEYLLQVFGKLQPIIRTQDVQSRSTSSITGLQKSATHRSLIDPGRTQQRYPQTSKYIQTMLEQTMKRYATLNGVLEQTEKEMVQGILGIKARVFEAAVNTLFATAHGGEKVQFGRVRDAIAEMGADAVYEILRGRAFPRSCLAMPKSGLFDTSAAADVERRRMLLQDQYGGARARRIVAGRRW